MNRRSSLRAFSLNGIGNLTLVRQKLNPALSNGPWKGDADACKRDGLRRHSKLEMNRRLLERHDDWTDLAIVLRADDLFVEARAIWPSAPQTT